MVNSDIGIATILVSSLRNLHFCSDMCLEENNMELQSAMKLMREIKSFLFINNISCGCTS